MDWIAVLIHHSFSGTLRLLDALLVRRRANDGVLCAVQRTIQSLLAALHDPVADLLLGTFGIEKLMTWDRYSLIGGVRIAERFVAADLARAAKNYDAAIATLDTAITLEDKLPYDEPPAWNWPTRMQLGAVLLDAGRPADAEQIFRDELKRNPENGWSLHGLARALKARGKTGESRDVADRFERAWANADVDLGRI